MIRAKPSHTPRIETRYAPSNLVTPLAFASDGKNTNVELNAIVNINIAKQRAKKVKFFNNDTSMKGFFSFSDDPWIDFLKVFHFLLNKEGRRDSIFTAAVISIDEANLLADWSGSKGTCLLWGLSTTVPFNSCLLAPMSSSHCSWFRLILLKYSQNNFNCKIPYLP